MQSGTAVLAQAEGADRGADKQSDERLFCRSFLSGLKGRPHSRPPKKACAAFGGSGRAWGVPLRRPPTEYPAVLQARRCLQRRRHRSHRRRRFHSSYLPMRRALHRNQGRYALRRARPMLGSPASGTSHAVTQPIAIIATALGAMLLVFTKTAGSVASPDQTARTCTRASPTTSAHSKRARTAIDIPCLRRCTERMHVLRNTVPARFRHRAYRPLRRGHTRRPTFLIHGALRPRRLCQNQLLGSPFAWAMATPPLSPRPLRIHRACPSPRQQRCLPLPSAGA